MTSRIFLNLRSTAFDPLNDLQVQSALALPLSSRRAAPLVFVRATVVDLDTSLFATASGVEGNEYTNPGPVLSPPVPGTKPSDDIELQARGGHMATNGCK